jgi:hypothetical protein
MVHEPHTEKRKQKTPIAAVVNVVSSVDITATLKTAFESGLNQGMAAGNVITPAYFPALGYGAGLDAQIKTFKTGLVVTLGGLVSYLSAQGNATTQFVSLVGGTPTLNGIAFPTPGTPAGTEFYGCVSLESYGGNTGNPSRMQYLATAPNPPRLSGNFAPGQICLLFNPNSIMHVAETSAWTAAGGAAPVQGGVDANGKNSNKFYATAFGNIPQPAVVVSADPFFHQSKDALVHAANNSKKFICYPLDNYRNSNPAPSAGHATVYGPKLEDAHKQLGLIARTVLTNGAAVAAIFRTPLGNPTDL